MHAPTVRPAPRKRWWLGCSLASLLLALLPVGRWFWHQRRAKEEWRQTEISLAQYDLATAAIHLDRYLVERPEDTNAWFLAARTARRLERRAEAEPV